MKKINTKTHNHNCCNNHHNDQCSCSVHEHNHDECCCGEDHGELPKNNSIYILVSILFFVSSFLLYIIIPQKILLYSAILVSGLSMFIKGFKNIIRFKFEEKALLLIAVVSACIIGEVGEAAAVTILFRIGEYFEAKAISKSRKEISSLTNIRADKANLFKDETTTQIVDAKTVAIGSKILIKAGERIPLDCVIIKGKSSIDNSALTGESISVYVQEGDILMSGGINIDGVIVCETTKEFENSSASRIIKLVEEASAKKGNTENFISKFAKIYTPIVIILAMVVAFLPPLLNMGELSYWVSNSLVFLVTSCPCAFVIAVPLSFYSGIGASSKHGVLVKGSKYIEILATAQSIVMDKTGTITTGKLKVSKIETIDKNYDIHKIAALAESYSIHPIAKAIVKSYGEIDISLSENVTEIAGMGIVMRYSGEEFYVGSDKLMKKYNIEIKDQANVYVATKNKLIGYIILSDTPREDANDTIKQLKEIGIKNITMLTGDNEKAAIEIKDKVGIDDVHAQLFPQDKVDIMAKIKEKYKNTLFIGDGINDAPVLAMSDAGVAMGLGSDTAINTADVVLIGDKLSSIVTAIKLSRRTMAVAKFNIGFALTVKILILVLGAMGLANMWMAVIADVGVTVIAVLNSTRLLINKKI